MGSPIHMKRNAYGSGDAQLYETLPEMVEAMIHADPWLSAPGRLILEPACGPGAITAVLQAFNHKVHAPARRFYPGLFFTFPSHRVFVDVTGQDFMIEG
ncbi:MAG: hypothetical protein AAFY56_16830, partial [Pseudomonadota bacterium]